MKFCSYIFFVFAYLLINNADSVSQKKTQRWEFEKKPVWSDEFDSGINIDSSKWSFEKGGDGWGNNELQYYTKGKNIELDSGILRIIAKKEDIHNRKYSSSRLVTKNKAGWKYGRIVIRARLPHGKGVWPAFWMLPETNSTPESVNYGEIDIMEYVGFEKDVIHFSVHTKAFNIKLKNGKSSLIKIKDAEKKFHKYRLDWTPYGIRGYADGIKYFEYKNNNNGSSYWPFDKKFFLILNLAVGGDWGGYNGIDDSIFPAALEIDYVRVYKFIK